MTTRAPSGSLMPTARPAVGEEELAAVSEVLASGWLGSGPKSRAFEEGVAQVLGAKHVVAVNNGTAAIHIALEVFGIGEGDEVIVPSLTFAACPQAVLATGARPVFAEIERNTICLDAGDVASRITPRTRAIMPVHYGGRACDMDSLVELAHANDVLVISDAAHAFGSTYHGKPVASYGDASTFSFDPIKTITCGEGGAVVVQDEEIAKRLRRLRILGIDSEGHARATSVRFHGQVVVDRGFRYHLSDINAAIGLEQLKKYEVMRDRRRGILARYLVALSDVDGAAVLDVDVEAVVPFHFVIRVLDDRRDAVLASLREAGIAAGVHYPPNHLQPFFEGLATDKPLPATEEVAGQILTLPLYPALTDQEVDFVCDAFVSALSR
jgi:dTDP-4-amino-4,6-dideoxygalactose transaminase